MSWRIALVALIPVALVVLLNCSGDDDGSSPGATSTSASSTGGAGGGSGGSGGGAAFGLDVTLDSGPVRGVLQGQSHAFLGIPYAAPPLGGLRFKAPQPVEPWSESLDASKVGPMCVQREPLGTGRRAGSSEDCLKLNVWRPATSSAEPLPVMVWIHGGGYEIGHGGDAGYSGQHIASKQNVMMVTLSYRLGPFGFLAHPDLTAEDPASASSGNYGFQDQTLALDWVKRNAAAFGGDPKRVTVFGESAGGMSTCLHLLAPASAGLFQRAIIQSGPCNAPARTLAEDETQGGQLAEALGCSSGVVECIRGKSADEIHTALPTNQSFFFGDGARWGPNVDGVVIDEQPLTSFGQSSFAKVEVMLGSNRDEGTIFIALAGLNNIDEAQYQTLVTQAAPTFGTDGPTMLAEYPASAYATPAAALAAALGHGGFNCPTRRLARTLAAASTDTYLYHFAQPVAFPLLGDLGAFHAAEIGFVFGTSTLGIVPLKAEELPLSDTMMGYWARFAASGDPNGQSAPSWPKYDGNGDQHMTFEIDGVAAASELLKAKCDFWDTLQK